MRERDRVARVQVPQRGIEIEEKVYNSLAGVNGLAIF